MGSGHIRVNAIPYPTGDPLLDHKEIRAGTTFSIYLPDANADAAVTGS